MTLTVDKAIEIVRDFLQEEHEVRMISDNELGYSSAPGKAIEAFDLIAAAISGDAALRAEIARLGEQMAALVKERDEARKELNIAKRGAA
jgi:hypothetical protein